MKTTQNFADIGDLSQLNISDHVWNDFYRRLNLGRNKTQPVNVSDFVTNSGNSSNECDDYCDSQVRDPLDYWKLEYHGYVSLIVSIKKSNIIEMEN